MMKDFEKIFKTLKDLLVSEDSSSTERVLDLQEEHEQILRAELESVPKVNLSRFSEDTLGTALLPEEQRGLRAVKVSGDGNCLYNSASVLIKGDETPSGTLRVLTVCELYFNAEFYANHAKISQASRVSPYSESLPSLCLARYYNILIGKRVNVTIWQGKCCKRVARRSRRSCNIREVSALDITNFFLGDQNFFMATILQLKVAKRRLFEKVSLER